MGEGEAAGEEEQLSAPMTAHLVCLEAADRASAPVAAPLLVCHSHGGCGSSMKRSGQAAQRLSCWELTETEMEVRQYCWGPETVPVNHSTSVQAPLSGSYDTDKVSCAEGESGSSMRDTTYPTLQITRKDSPPGSSLSLHYQAYVSTQCVWCLDCSWGWLRPSNAQAACNHTLFYITLKGHDIHVPF